MFITLSRYSFVNLRVYGQSSNTSVMAAEYGPLRAQKKPCKTKAFEVKHGGFEPIIIGRDTYCI